MYQSAQRSVIAFQLGKYHLQVLVWCPLWWRIGGNPGRKCGEDQPSKENIPGSNWWRRVSLVSN